MSSEQRWTNGRARFSNCRRFRYLLSRDFLDHGQHIIPLVFVCLNPSTADAKKDDPTIRRCIGFAEGFGYGGLIIANIYAYRSTDPKELWEQTDPVGHYNDETLRTLARKYSDIVCAWGVNAKPDRVKHFHEFMTAGGATLLCLGTTKNGSPRHPLYLRSDTVLTQWELPK